jgi:hypothetical protein
LVGAKGASLAAEKAKAEVEAQLQEAVHEKSKIEETMVKSTSLVQSELMAMKYEQEASKSENLVRIVFSRVKPLDFYLRLAMVNNDYL